MKKIVLRCYLVFVVICLYFSLVNRLTYTHEACCDLYATEAHPNTVLLNFLHDRQCSWVNSFLRANSEKFWG